MGKIKIQGFEDRTVKQYEKELIEQAARFMIVKPDDMAEYLKGKEIVSVNSGRERDRYVPASKENYNS